MFEEERLHKIAEYVQNKSRATVSELCESFDISESTARRDLTELENRRLLKRTHGGAVSIESVAFEPTYFEKEDKYRKEKENIAKKAAEYIEDGDTLIIDSGTTTLFLASELAQFKNLTVVTNSINLITKLALLPDITVISTGGTLRKNTLAFVGPVAEQMLDSLRVDKAFIATNGIDINRGLTTPNIVEAATKRKMISVADQVFILSDRSKFGRVSFAKFGELEDIDACITGAEISEKQLTEFESKNVKIYTAGKN